ncbi:hypothetical protein BH11PAT2_BH11PAT2_08340 [soil metagenome]
MSEHDEEIARLYLVERLHVTIHYYQDLDPQALTDF